MRYSICSMLLLGALFVQSAAFSTPLAPACADATINTTTMRHASHFDDTQSDKEKEKKKPAKKSKSSAAKSDSKKESGANADAGKDAKENSDAKTGVGDSKAADAATKKDTGFGWTAILVSVVVSLGAGAGIVLIFLRRRAQAPNATEPKALLPSVEAEVVVVESKVVQPAAKKEAHIAREAFASEATRTSAPEFRVERASEKPILPKSPPAPEPANISTPEKTLAREPTPLSESLNAPEKTVVKDKVAAPETPVAGEKVTESERRVVSEKATALENIVPSAKSPTPEKNAAAPTSDADATGLLLDDNSVEAALEGKTSSKDLFMLNELAQKPKESSDDFVSDQLLLPDETELLIEPESAPKEGTIATGFSLLSRYQRLTTPEEERDFMNHVRICTVSNFEDVFGNDAAKPVFAENEAGSFLLSKHAAKDGCAEVFILRNFPIDDFLMQESLAPVFHIQRSSSVSSGFVVKSPALASQSEQGWTLVAKGEILVPA